MSMYITAYQPFAMFSCACPQNGKLLSCQFRDDLWSTHLLFLLYCLYKQEFPVQISICLNSSRCRVVIHPVVHWRKIVPTPQHAVRVENSSALSHVTSGGGPN